MTMTTASKMDFLTIANFKQLLTMLDKMNINYSVFDTEGHYIAQNESMARRITRGKTQAVAIDEPSWMHCQLVMANGKTVIAEEPFEDKTYLSIKQPIYQKGICLGIIVLSVDITAEKQNEQSQAKITQLKMIAGSMAHEMRTPLATLMIGVNTLKRHLAPLIQAYQYSLEHNEHQEEISGSQLIGLQELPANFEQCLKECSVFIAMQLSNMNQEKISSSSFGIFSLTSVIRDAVAQYSFKGNELSRLNITWPTHSAECYGDPILVKRILWNLIRNALYAIKVARKGNIQIWLESSNGYRYLHIKDTALGMSREALNNIFDMHYTDKHHGSGLGLYFCQSVMDALGGSIDCESNLGSYTHFTLKFPSTSQKLKIPPVTKLEMPPPHNEIEQALIQALAAEG